MHFTLKSSVAAAILLSLGAEASVLRALQDRSSVETNVWKPTAFKEPSTLSKSSNFAKIKKVKSPSGSKRRPGSLGAATSSNNSVGLISLEIGEEFATTITIGTQSLEVVFDTGSSDTFVVESDFDCVYVANKTQAPQSECGWGTPYTIDSTFSPVPNEILNITYGDSEFITGPIGTETITLANVTVEKQTFAVGNYTGWNGDGVTSGLVGFSYPAITSAYSTKTHEQEEYNPLFTSMYTEGLVDPYFSIALLRDVSGPSGYVTLGGLPPIDFDETFTTTPIHITTILGFPFNYDFYSIAIDSLNMNGKAISGSSDVHYVVDSGTTLNLYPNSIADEINAAFSPPGVYDDDSGAYFVDCNAKAPEHSVTINGTTFDINPLDMILDAGQGQCISGFSRGGADALISVYILGDTFQKNVVSVFDVGAAEMKFAPHVNYTSNDTY